MRERAVPFPRSPSPAVPRRGRSSWLAVLIFLAARFATTLSQGATPTAFDPRHTLWGRVLEGFVQEARVDYARLKARPADLDAYLGTVAAIAPEDFARWPRDQRLATLLNLYNAQTLRLIADHHPVASIKSIGLLPGSAWKMKVVRFGGRTMSLDDLEHGLLRKEFQEPRVHFALVCGARGCPPLRGEPYLAEKLDQQLDDQGRRFLADTTRNRVDSGTGTLWLSPIFDWFKADFTGQGGTLPGFVARFLPESARNQLATLKEPRIRFTEYDWSLNELASTRPALP